MVIKIRGHTVIPLSLLAHYLFYISDVHLELFLSRYLRENILELLGNFYF